MKNLKSESKLPTNLESKGAKDIPSHIRPSLINENMQENKKSGEKKAMSILKNSGMLDAYKCKL